MTSDAREKKQTCPSCSEKLSEVKLVPSPALEAIVDAYKAAR
jgi:transcription initiation factor IIE alpha subunit